MAESMMGPTRRWLVPVAGLGTLSVAVILALGGLIATTPAAAAVAPTVIRIVHAGGPLSGGTSVRVVGAGFTNGGSNGAPDVESVHFGTTLAPEFSVKSDKTLVVSSPAAPASANVVDITVTTINGTSTTASSDQFTYRAATSVPQNSKRTPQDGPSGGVRSTCTNGPQDIRLQLGDGVPLPNSYGNSTSQPVNFAVTMETNSLFGITHTVSTTALGANQSINTPGAVTPGSETLTTR